MRQNWWKWAVVAVVATSLGVPGSALADPFGALDAGFGDGGKVVTDFNGRNDFIGSAALQADGRIVVVGSTLGADPSSGFEFSLVRHNSDGSLDTSFGGSGGRITTDVGGDGGGANTVAIQADGKIVAAGSVETGFENDDWALARYNPNGSLDTSFGDDGIVTTDVGVGFTDVAALAIQADGKIVAVGDTGTDDPESGFWVEDWALARYNPNGSLDTTYGDDGKVITVFGSSVDQARSAALQVDGKLVVAGRNGSDFALARYTEGGDLDPAFSGDGKVTTGFGDASAEGVVLQPDGRIVVVGYGTAGAVDDLDFALARYQPDGSLDTSFGGGKVLTDFGSNLDFGISAALDANGSIVVGGAAAVDGDGDFALARYRPDGSLDPDFGSAGRLTTDFDPVRDDEVRSVLVQADGKVVAAGLVGYEDFSTTADFALARYGPGGTEITSPGPPGPTPAPNPPAGPRPVPVTSAPVMAECQRARAKHRRTTKRHSAAKRKVRTLQRLLRAGGRPAVVDRRKAAVRKWRQTAKKRKSAVRKTARQAKRACA